LFRNFVNHFFEIFLTLPHGQTIALENSNDEKGLSYFLEARLMAHFMLNLLMIGGHNHPCLQNS